MALDRTTGAKILIDEARELTETYQSNNPTEQKCYFVGADHVMDILGQTGCIGIRIYKGLDKGTKKETLVLIGVDEDGKDMTEGHIVDRLKACPDFCPEPSVSLIA